MVKKYRMRLRNLSRFPAEYETAYNLYAFLLSKLQDFDNGDALHSGIIPPVCQHIVPGFEPVWTVNLLGEAGISLFDDALAELEDISLEHNGFRFRIEDKSVSEIRSVDTLLSMGKAHRGAHSLRFVSPAAYKSNGRYVCMPTMQLLIGSLIKKWNSSFPDFQIEDEDGMGASAIAAGLEVSRYSLESTSYNMKGSHIPSFTGWMEINNRLEGFHRELADSLLIFSAYSGAGIKTALGMGGISSGGRK